jgi:hypothetical protein
MNFSTLGTGPGHIITLSDSNFQKTIATANNRPANDANDAFLGYDQVMAIQRTWESAWERPSRFPATSGMAETKELARTAYRECQGLQGPADDGFALYVDSTVR